MGGYISVMEHLTRNKLRFIILLCVLIFALFGVVYLGYFCPDKVCALTPGNPTSPEYPVTFFKLQSLLEPEIRTTLRDQTSAEDFDVIAEFGGDSSKQLTNMIPYTEIVNKKVKFEISGNDVMVFLHIQKTGGTTFGRHLVENLDLEYPCRCQENRKRCKCIRSETDRTPWLFSRYSTGWVCGLHADWTEITNCVEGAMDKLDGNRLNKRYFYTSLLRDPVHRFLSEFLHVRRGATWKQAKHWCGGRGALDSEIQPCFRSDTWEGVSLANFLACPDNLAINRQTRMLADLSLVNCYNKTGLVDTERERILLDSAKRNLEGMAFYGLCELQDITQAIFEDTFQLKFLSHLVQFNDTHVSQVIEDIDPDDLQAIKDLNYLDIQLYQFAKELLLQRYEELVDRGGDAVSSDGRRQGGVVIYEDEESR